MKKTGSGKGRGLLWFCVLWSGAGLFQDAEFLADLGEGCDASVKVLLLVAGGYLYTDTGLVFRHYRVVESGYEDAFVHSMTAQIADSVGLMSKPAAFILLMK